MSFIGDGSAIITGLAVQNNSTEITALEQRQNAGYENIGIIGVYTQCGTWGKQYSIWRVFNGIWSWKQNSVGSMALLCW